MFLKALKNCPKSNKLPNLVTLNYYIVRQFVRSWDAQNLGGVKKVREIIFGFMFGETGEEVFTQKNHLHNGSCLYLSLRAIFPMNRNHTQRRPFRSYLHLLRFPTVFFHQKRFVLNRSNIYRGGIDALDELLKTNFFTWMVEELLTPLNLK